MLFTQSLVDDAKLQVQEALIFLCDLRPSEVSQVMFEIINAPHKLPSSVSIQVDLEMRAHSDPDFQMKATVYMLEYSDRNLPDGVILTKYTNSSCSDVLQYYPIYSRDANESTISPDLRRELRALLIR